VTVTRLFPRNWRRQHHQAEAVKVAHACIIGRR
jgi:hypothetical protein